ncbi:group II intron reverse transcriptase/maturase [Desulfosarcina widdelii]|uniref:RNA-directed DNA polymerase n=2 Tax=Desulfosarcina widdelii TaxID=947919 RepID=A0A5K7ZEJ2_9BACT|nr:group II intron reverse transcriptase/maturase [Desulfosarcina widdelii]
MTKTAAEGCSETGAAMAEGRGRYPREYAGGAGIVTATSGHCLAEHSRMMEAVVGCENMLEAYQRVRANKGAAGVDGMDVDELWDYCKAHWSQIRAELLEDRYKPRAVLGVQIPKPNGGMRQLGIPTALDRLIQQAVHQVLQPIFDPDFSEFSYGFRPGRSAHQAVLQAQSYVADGRRWIVDMDLEKFFDKVNHDILMSRVARKVKDKRVLRLIRRYLQAGMMMDGAVSARTQGTPQGGPLSPLLSNILLDELDKELERRGHRFCRYADDCNIYVQSRRAGERVLASITQFLNQRLKLKVNAAKSAVDRPWKRSFLGYSMTWHKPPRLKVAPKAIKRLKQGLRAVFRWGRGRSLKATIMTLEPKLRGWVNYFKLSQVKGVFEQLDGWIRRKLRNIIWRHWKRNFTRAKNLMRMGLSEERAWRSATNGRGPWWNSGASHMNQAFPKLYFDRRGLVSLLDQLRGLQSTT